MKSRLRITNARTIMADGRADLSLLSFMVPGIVTNQHLG